MRTAGLRGGVTYGGWEPNRLYVFRPKRLHPLRQRLLHEGDVCEFAIWSAVHLERAAPRPSQRNTGRNFLLS